MQSKKETVMQEMSEMVSARIGHKINCNHIHTDEIGWTTYIPRKSLYSNHPLILAHYRGPLFMVIPYMDMKKLELEEISVEEYIDNSTWNFGYYWGGGSILNGVHWQPFEEKGISDTERISRYLTILKCRTSKISSGYTKRCEECSILNCPVKNPKSDWSKEVKEYDDRIALFKEIQSRLKEKFGLKLLFCRILKEEPKNYALIFPEYERNTVSVCFSQNLFIDLMYNHTENIKDVADNIQFEVGVYQHYGKKGQQYPYKKELIPTGADAKFVTEFWKENTDLDWYEEQKKEDKENMPLVAYEKDEPKKKKGLFSKLFSASCN